MAKAPLVAITVCSSSAEEEDPFNIGLPSTRSTRYHLSSAWRSHPRMKKRFDGKVFSVGLHWELTWARRRCCPSQECCEMAQRVLPVATMRISPTSDKVGGVSQEERKK